MKAKNALPGVISVLGGKGGVRMCRASARLVLSMVSSEGGL